MNALSHQLRHPPGPPGLHGPHMYAQRMAMDPRFAYPAHIRRHGDPSLNHVPRNFNMQVLILMQYCLVASHLNKTV